MGELVEKRRMLQEGLKELEDKIRLLRERADEAHQAMLERLQEADALRVEETSIVERLRLIDLEEKRRAEREAKVNLLKLAKAALEKLRRGDKVTVEELKAIAEAEDMGVI